VRQHGEHGNRQGTGGLAHGKVSGLAGCEWAELLQLKNSTAALFQKRITSLANLPVLTLAGASGALSIVIAFKFDSWSRTPVMAYGSILSSLYTVATPPGGTP